MKGRRSQTIAPDHVSIGQVVGSHGIKGGLKVTPLTDFLERFEIGNRLFLGGVAHTILDAHRHKEQVRLTLSDITHPEAGDELRWEYLTVPKTDLPILDDDEYMADDLIGLDVVTTEGRSLGPVLKVTPNPAHDLLEVDGAMIPMVKEFIKMIDFEAKTITVQLIPGMAPGEDAEEIR